jgi:hypothetical protein
VTRCDNGCNVFVGKGWWWRRQRSLRTMRFVDQDDDETENDENQEKDAPSATSILLIPVIDNRR